jgi:nucleoside-diphosphate kinase
MKTIQRTFAIVKPDAVEKNVSGEIINMIEKNGFRIIGAKMLHINKAQAEGWRKLMGATNPANAEDGTIRKRFAKSIEENAVHGSDAEDTARFELSYFFAGYELAK